MKNPSECKVPSPREVTDKRGDRVKDELLETLERTEKRVIAMSFLLAKVISVAALLAALVLLEAGVVKRIWETEFRAEPVHAQSSLMIIAPSDRAKSATFHAQECSPAPSNNTGLPGK